MAVTDKVISISKAGAVSNDMLGTALEDLKISDINPDIVAMADVLIVFTRIDARVMKNRFTNRMMTMSISNMGGYIKSEIYRIEENASEL